VKGSTDVLELLISKGANVNVVDKVMMHY
jgi:hypothetical protein